MFKNQISARMKNIFGKDLIRYGCKIIKRIWRIGEDDIELFPAYFKEFENVVPNDCKIAQRELRSLRLYEIGM